MGYFAVDLAVCLQVRINSARLPFKAILPLKGGVVIQHTIKALTNVKADLYLLLTDEDSYGYLKPFIVGTPFEIFVGPSEDVLARYYLAAKKYSVRTVVRATGDNPLVSAIYTDKIVEIHRRSGADLSHYLDIPLGTGVEVIERDALEQAYFESVDPFEHEHITTYMYRHRDFFRVVERIPDNPDIRCNDKVSIDTVEDYKKISLIYSKLYRGNPIELPELVRWLKLKKFQGIGGIKSA